MRDKLHAEDVLDMLFSVLAVAGYLHTAALTASASVNLRLDHYAARALGEEFARLSGCLFWSVSHLAFGHGHAILRQDLFCLIFVNFHVGWNRLVC
jgi:hypothetical protein